MRIKHYLLITSFFACSHSILAQNLDQAKMDRDLKIAEDVVSSLIKGQSNEGRFYAASPKASYIPGFGVMIDINSSGKFYSNNFDDSYNISFVYDDDAFEINVDELAKLEMKAEILARQAEEIERQAEIVERENERIAREHQRALDEQERELERKIERLEREREREEEIKVRREFNQKTEVEPINDDEYTYRYSYSHSDEEDEEDRTFVYAKRGFEKDFEDLKPMYRDVMTTFLADYADLIGQLADHEQVMLISKGSPQGFGIIHSSTSDESNKFSAATTRKNISDFKAGRISRSNFESNINFVESKGAEKKPADLELLSSILQRLYKTDLATTFFTTSPIMYEKLKGFGVIYNMRMYSSVSIGRDNYRMPTQKKSNLNQQERDKQAEVMYPQFITEFKKNILDYGKTINSLDTDESILFRVNLSDCNSCDTPKEINILVKNQTLRDFDSSKINESEALQKIEIKEAF